MKMKVTIWVDIDPDEKDQLAEAVCCTVTELKECGWDIECPVVIVEA